MIIDAHTHIGDFVKISMPEDVFSGISGQV